MKLIFIHGSGGWGGIWEKQLAYFADAEAITLPGHPDGERCKSVEEYAAWLHRVIEYGGYRSVILAGHSLGGAIVMAYALKYADDLSAIILIGTGARLKVHRQFISMLEEAINGDFGGWVQWMKETYSSLLPEEQAALVEKHLEIGPLAQLNDLVCCDKFDIMENVHEIRVPTLVICGNQDTMTPIKFTNYLAEKIPGAKKVIIEGTTHHLFLEKPDEFNKALDEFIRALGH
jgi:pimeloyl-ACP methyl ester carboxylesterase